MRSSPSPNKIPTLRNRKAEDDRHGIQIRSPRPQAPHPDARSRRTGAARLCARTICSNSASRRNIFWPTPRASRRRPRHRTRCSRRRISAPPAGSSANSCRPRSRSQPSRTTASPMRGVSFCSSGRMRPALRPNMGFRCWHAAPIPARAGANSVQSPKDRYAKVMDDLQMIGQRNMLCGMHVHVEFPDPSRRIDVMTRMLPYLPLFIALSASSPFWQGRATGLKGYRLAAYDELPRTGLPELFRTTAEYDAYVDAMVSSGAMADASHLWWAIRPSLKYPTLELRALGFLHPARRHRGDRHPLSRAGPVLVPPSGAQCRDRRGRPRRCGRKQMARPALRRPG